MRDSIDRQAAIDALWKERQRLDDYMDECFKKGLTALRAGTKAERNRIEEDIEIINDLPSAQQERLTDDDFETIRIHLNAFKENLCNQGRWKEAVDYERLIDRFMSFASAQPEAEKHGKWIKMSDADGIYYCCSECGEELYRKWSFYRDYDLFHQKESIERTNFCPNCGARMEESER